ncbi:MAG: YqgE/AlgH family protein [Alphaproteobacteria bacterium]|nr:YqgE/AlgH family protein [Alphaproteobacteria bacterium]
MAAKDDLLNKTPWLSGQILVAMPGMSDPRFEKTIVLMCSHGPSGALGLVLNRLFGDLSFEGLLAQFDIDLPFGAPERPICFGGPVEPVRGFVLHGPDYREESTADITSSIKLTATIEVLRALAEGKGPGAALLLLGYAGWGAGQLEAEIQSNGWLTVPADDTLVFDPDIHSKWDKAMAKIGVSPTALSGDFGHA